MAERDQSNGGFDSGDSPDTARSMRPPSTSHALRTAAQYDDTRTYNSVVRSQGDRELKEMIPSSSRQMKSRMKPARNKLRGKNARR